MYVADELKEKVKQFSEHYQNCFDTFAGFELKHLESDRVVIELPITEKVLQPFGLLHGGVSVALAESLASLGTWLNVDTESYDVVGIEINANHLRPVKDGKVIGTATPIHRGRSTYVWNIEITNERGKRTCVSRCTVAVVRKK